MKPEHTLWAHPLLSVMQVQHIACVPKAKTDAHETEKEDYFDESDEGAFGFELSALA